MVGKGLHARQIPGVFFVKSPPAGATPAGGQCAGGPSPPEAVPLGAEGVWRTLYAAVRVEEQDAPYPQDFLAVARALCFRDLSGIRMPRGQGA